MEPIHFAADSSTGLLVVNTRQSRLDLFLRRESVGEAPDRADFEDPNFLPFAEDFELEEIPLARLPYRAATHDLDGDGTDEILYLQGDPRKLVVLGRDAEGGWSERSSWEVADSEPAGRQPLLVRPDQSGTPKILLSFSDGVQVIDTSKSGDEAVEWLQPRERDVSRNRWWLVDLDEDGDLDLVEGTDSTTAPVRWYEAEGDRLRPAVNISEGIQNTNIARLLRTPEGPRLAFLGAHQNNTLSLYELGRGESSPLGQRNLLPLDRAEPLGWASLELDGQPAVVECGGDKPILNLFVQRDGFWEFREAFPLLSEVEAVFALRDAHNRLLFRVKDEGTLYVSRWEDGRFTFPRPLEEIPPGGTEAEIIAFDQYGAETWWVTQEEVADATTLILHVLGPDDSAPRETVFPGLEDVYENGLWVGGDRLLLLKRYGKSATLCQLDEDGTAALSPTRFTGAELDRFQYADETLYLLDDGVVQKLDSDLQVVDQIMLSGDDRIRDFVPLTPTAAYALDESGEDLHRLEADESGIFRSVWKESVPFALGVAQDPVLGLTLIGNNHLNLPSEGASRQLVRTVRFDPNERTHRRSEDTQLSTLFVVDIDGDGFDEIAAPDYQARTVIVYRPNADTLEEVISWKVFDDDKYPYGAPQNQGNNLNPYNMLALDLDADAVQDLVLASHDRLLFYLARDPQL